MSSRPLGIALLALPLELVLVGMSGKAYKHYYMALLPIFSIFAGLAFWFMLTRLADLPSERKRAFSSPLPPSSSSLSHQQSTTIG